jgi:RHS repeat-associated protein
MGGVMGLRDVALRIRSSKFLMPATATALSLAVFLCASCWTPAKAQTMAWPGKFEVNAAGAATYSIPIMLPKGTAGMTPSLSLVYNSQGGNGILGQGWSLDGLPSIGRCPRTVAQDGARGAVNYDANDRFCLDGQRLFAIGTYGGGTEYRTEIESYSRVISYGVAGTGPAWFEVHTKTGQVMEFGNTPDSQVLAQGTTTVRNWAVNKVSDTKGNYFVVGYINDTVNGQAYPDHIGYTANDAAGTSAANIVQFVYSTARPDTAPLYHAGSLIQTTVLLTELQTYGDGSPTVDYRLTYQQGSATGRSRLTSMQACAFYTLADGTAQTTDCLPATTFNWRDGGLSQTVTANVAGQDGTLAGFRPYLGDFNGDGIPDIMWDSGTDPQYHYTGPTRVLWTGTGTGSFTVSGNFAGLDGTVVGVPVVADFNGDGITDVWWYPVAYDYPWPPAAMTQWQSTKTGTFTVHTGPVTPASPYASSFPSILQPMIGFNDPDGLPDLTWQRLDPWPGLDFWSTNSDGTVNAIGGFSVCYANPDCNPAPNFATIYNPDFNGDGISDLLVVIPPATQPGGTMSLFFGSIDGFGFTKKAGANSSVTGYSPYFGDFNGDGNSDILWDHVDANGRSSGQRILWLSRGDGTFVVVTNVGGQDGAFVGYRPYFGDFNGDGKLDILWDQEDTNGLSAGSRVLWIGKGDGTFTVISNFGGQDGTLIGYAPLLADFNSDGKTDILWNKRSGADTRSAGQRVLWLSDGVTPDLLTSVTTGLGATTAITYQPLTNNAVYTKDNTAVYPLVDVQAPMYVVSRVDTANGIGGTYSSSYTYAGAKADQSGRGFLGFRQTTVTDLQTNIVQTVTYRQDYPYLSLVASQTTTLNGATLKSTTSTYGSTSLGGTRYQVFPTQIVVSSSDLDGSTVPTVTTTYQYDGFGNATQITVTTSDGYIKTTTNTYTNDTVNWLLGRLTNASVTSQTPSLASATRTSSFAYDPASGLLTQEVIEPNLPNYRLQSDYTYDVFGNKVGVTVSGAGVAPRTASTTYDPFGQFAISATNALGQSESWAFDWRAGLPSSHTGPNGLTTTWAYDVFGRKYYERLPDGKETMWDYQYCAGVNGGTASCPAGAAYLVQKTVYASGFFSPVEPVKTTYYDQLDRIIAADTQGFDGSPIRSATQYDALGRVAQKSRPYFVATDTPRWQVVSYDGLGRPVTETFPDGSTLRHAYHGLTTSDTNALNQTRTTVKNSQGQVVSVTDATGHSNSYVYDPFSNMTQVTDAAGNVSTYSYDQRGRKIASNDPDIGAWSYAYDALNELTTQTDAKGQATTVAYDLLGRMTQRVEADQTSTWTYDTALHGIGKLASASTGTAYQRTHSYDAFGRPVQVQTTISGNSYSFTTSYDGASRVSAVTYPSGFGVTNYYNQFGYLAETYDSTSFQVYWAAQTADAELHLTQQFTGFHIPTNQSFDPNTGRLTDIQVGGGAVENFSYTYDVLGNLLSRADANTGLSETFGYDALNRLTSSTVGLSLAKAFAYNPIGNLISKSDVGTYAYPAAGQPRPHGVLSVSGGTIQTTFAYDPNGNQTSGLGRTIGYTSFNKPSVITQGSTTILFQHDPEHQRYQQTSPQGTTLYFADPASGVMAEKVTGALGVTQWNNYLFAGGNMIGMHVERSDGTAATRFFHKDHLGSVSTITDEYGTVLERLSYDAWGKRRFPDGTDDPAGSIESQATRGFTGHEELDGVGLVHMNGRVYDPLLGRFGSADPMTESPFSTQGLNRYSYVGNNPINFTDPSGYCFLGCFWQKIGTFLNRTFGAVFRKFPILGNIFEIAAVALCLGNPVCALPVAFAATTFVVGVTSGNLGYALRAGFIAAATATANFGVGDITEGIEGLGGAISNVAGHALVGCGSALASGGKCGPAALAGGVSAAATPFIDAQFPDPLHNPENLFAGTAISATAGGLASVAGGDKFANGAVTGAFGYLFNAIQHSRHHWIDQSIVRDLNERGLLTQEAYQYLMNENTSPLIFQDVSDVENRVHLYDELHRAATEEVRGLVKDFISQQGITPDNPMTGGYAWVLSGQVRESNLPAIAELRNQINDWVYFGKNAANEALWLALKWWQGRIARE